MTNSHRRKKDGSGDLVAVKCHAGQQKANFVFLGQLVLRNKFTCFTFGIFLEGEYRTRDFLDFVSRRRTYWALDYIPISRWKLL
jgi:hypothetical protein